MVNLTHRLETGWDITSSRQTTGNVVAHIFFRSKICFSINHVNHFTCTHTNWSRSFTEQAICDLCHVSRSCIQILVWAPWNIYEGKQTNFHAGNTWECRDKCRYLDCVCVHVLFFFMIRSNLGFSLEII